MKAVELEDRFKTHLMSVESNKDELIQLYGESMSMYQRSMIPQYEKPPKKKSKESPPPLSEQVSNAFVSIGPFSPNPLHFFIPHPDGAQGRLLFSL